MKTAQEYAECVANEVRQPTEQHCAIQNVTTSTFERTWHNANFPPEEGGRFWCVVEEQNDLGKSRFQWNCAYNPTDKQWSDNGKIMNVTHYTELAPMPV